MWRMGRLDHRDGASDIFFPLSPFFFLPEKRVLIDRMGGADDVRLGFLGISNLPLNFGDGVVFLFVSFSRVGRWRCLGSNQTEGIDNQASRRRPADGGDDDFFKVWVAPSILSVFILASQLLGGNRIRSFN